MANDINFEAKTDRELLLLTAQQVNQMSADVRGLREGVDDHEARLSKVEGRLHGNPCRRKVNGKSLTVKLGIPGAGGTLGGIVYGVGKLTGWW